eukprot:1942263-Alexandrium_andersonii.AAC.1
MATAVSAVSSTLGAPTPAQAAPAPVAITGAPQTFDVGAPPSQEVGAVVGLVAPARPTRAPAMT